VWFIIILKINDTVKLQIPMTLFKMFCPLIGLFLFMTFIWILVLIGFNSNYYSVHAYVDKQLQLPIIHNDSNLKTELVFIGLDHPTSMAFLGADDILVLEKNEGKVIRIANGSIMSQPVLDVNVANKVERGMLGIAVSKHLGNTYVFIYFTEADSKDGGKALGNRLYRYELLNDKLVQPKLLLDLPASPGTGRNGGAVSIGPDGNVYVSVGDINGCYQEMIQLNGTCEISKTKAQNNHDGVNPDGRAGILRVTQDGNIVESGILGPKYPLNLYYAYGIRNSFGLDWDPLTGILWDTENGPHYGDEVNLVQPGFNSGWNKVQGIWKPTPNGTLGDEVTSKDFFQRQYHFVIATSTDGTTFTNKFSGDSSGIALNSEKYAFAPTNARYVRVTVNGNTQNSYASLDELDVSGSSNSSCTGTNLPIGGATASGFQTGYPPSNAIDNDFSTRWSSTSSGSEIRVDLGSTKSICSVNIAWFNGSLLVDFDGKGKYRTPEFIWRDTVGPTAIAFLNSDKLGKKYSNDILVGDITNGNIYHFTLNKNRTGLSLEGALVDNVADTDAENEDIIFGSGFKGITDMQVGPDGYLYILSYYDGAIFRIVPKQSIIPKPSIINLLDEKHIWRPFSHTIISQNDGTLTIKVDTHQIKKIFNRSFLPTKINYLMNKTLLLNLDYVSKSDMGNATFLAEIIENSSSYNTTGTKKILWESLLHNTSGNLTSETFILPDEVANKPVEIRLYVVTEGKGQHTLTIKKANIVHL
jgi:glucose/arabinose dehydrogenase